MANREKTYEFVQAAFRIGDEEAVDVGMLAGSFFGKGPGAGCRVARVRERINKYQLQPWAPALLAILDGVDDQERVGRFRALHTPWSAKQLKPRVGWVSALQALAQATKKKDAVSIALTMEKNLSGHKGKKGFLLGQFMHLLHPTWFAVVNGGNEAFWKKLGYAVGGVANLERVSADYREQLRGDEEDFNAIDDFIAVPWARKYGKKK